MGTSRDGGNLGQGRLRLALGLLVSRFAPQQQLENCSFPEVLFGWRGRDNLFLSVKEEAHEEEEEEEVLRHSFLTD